MIHVCLLTAVLESGWYVFLVSYQTVNREIYTIQKPFGEDENTELAQQLHCQPCGVLLLQQESECMLSSLVSFNSFVYSDPSGDAFPDA